MELCAMASATLRSLLIVIALLFSSVLSVVYDDPTHVDTTAYDYIIVGAGTAGLALASRLSENLSVTVLVLEAGMSDENLIAVTAPYLAATLTPSTPFDWNFTVVPQIGQNNRIYPYPRGRMLGGSSSVNYMVHQYAGKDYWDRTAEVTGDKGWSWDNMRRYIARHENFVVPPIDKYNVTNEFDPSLHSHTGVVNISLPTVSLGIDSRIIKTAQQLAEFPYNEDINGINHQIGVGWVQSTIHEGRRISSSTSYLAAAVRRPNLTVVINAIVTKLVPTGSSNGLQSFRKVQFTDSRKRSLDTTYEVEAHKEVILSAGSIGSIQILQLSGIGDPDDLFPLGIPVVVPNAWVGKNLQDHPLLPNIFTVTENGSMDHVFRNQSAMEAAVLKWVTEKTGFVSNNVMNNIGFGRLDPSLLVGYDDPSAGSNAPHYEMIFANYWLTPASPPPQTGDYFTIATALLTPTSRGTVKINSTNPFDVPLIDPNMLTTEWDIHVLRESVRAAKRFASAPAWDGYITGSVGKLFSDSDADIEAHARRESTTVFHPTSTASMASQAASEGVVNPDLTVKGTSGLRIVDLSILPFIPNCHPQGSAYLIAERAAELIKAKEETQSADLSPQYVISP